MEALKKAEQLKAELDALRPIAPEAERRIMQKFRLDWNYHSNKLEGNSLTFGETKALLLHGITAGTKPLKDYLEIKGHDEAIKWVEEIIKNETLLTEKFIRELHTLILKEPYEIDAQTPDGKPTKRLIKVGEYKTQPNHVLTQTGEMFYFAEPFETPVKMRELVDWFREKKEADINAVLIAAEFHYRFIRIHPFDDGNGRVARILMNFILMQYGYPPVIIKTEDKQNYIFALQQADAGIYEPFFEYIANNLIHSLEIMIKGAEGESIEEPEDFDKELRLFEATLSEVGNKVEVIKTKESFSEILNKSIVSLVNELLNNWKKFDSFYFESELSISPVFFVTEKYSWGERREPIQENYESTSLSELVDAVNELLIEEPNLEVSKITVRYYYKLFNRTEFGGFNYTPTISIRFAKTEYVITSLKTRIKLHKPYSQHLTQSDIEKIVKAENKFHLEYLEKRKKKFEKSTKNS